MTGKNKIALPDTNIIIRYLLNDHKELSKEANKIFALIENGKNKALITECVFTECIFILSKVYSVPKDVIAETLSYLLKYKGIINNDKIVLNSALTLYKTTNLHIVDCILAAKASYHNYELLTFDKELKNNFHRNFSKDN